MWYKSLFPYTTEHCGVVARNTDLYSQSSGFEYLLFRVFHQSHYANTKIKLKNHGNRVFHTASNLL
jgi:hypothetical protein